MKRIVNWLARSTTIADMIFSFILYGINLVLSITKIRFPFFRERVKEKNLTVQIKLKDNSRGRYFIFKDGNIISGNVIHKNPDVSVIFDSPV